MNPVQLNEKSLTIMEVVDKGTQIKLKGDDGKTYSFWKTKQDGTTTKAYQQFQEMKLGAQSKVAIAYKDTEGSFEGKKITYHNIMWFDTETKQEVPKVEIRHEENVGQADDSVWDAKDRLSAAQSAAKFVSTVYEGKAVNFSSVKDACEEVYQWLMAKKEGSPTDLIPDLTEDDIPFPNEDQF